MDGTPAHDVVLKLKLIFNFAAVSVMSEKSVNGPF